MEKVFEEEEVNLMAATMPFMDSQLHALYHNVELEKNIEFVDHFLGVVMRKKSGQKSDIVWLGGGGVSEAPMPCLTFFLKKLKII